MRRGVRGISSLRTKGAAVQKLPLTPDFTEITPQAQIGRHAHGWRAKCLQRLVRLELPVPATVEPLRYNLVWHERTHRDPAMVWFRKQVLDAARGLAD